jgi:acyl-CoA synthetase (AMP-forming)/AMP-acid ligase II
VCDQGLGRRTGRREETLMSLAQFAKSNPDKPAFIGAEIGESLSFGQLNERSIRLSRLLRARLEVGDRVALLLDNGPGYYCASWAARRAGLRFVPINWHLGAEEAAYIAVNSDSRALIASPRMASLAETLAGRIPGLELLLADGEGFGAFQPLHAAIAAESADPLDPELEGVFMFYSSGTTGQPKGILRAMSGKPFGDRIGIEHLMAGLFSFDETARFYSPAPLYHAAPLGWTMGTQNLGGTAVVASRFDAEATLRHIQEHRVTHAQFVPTHFVRLLQLPDEVRAKYDVSSLRMVVHSAAPCPVEVKERMMAWWGPIIHEYYGQSEGAGFTAVGPQDWLAHKGTVGRSVGGPILIVDDEGRELPPGETGHIMFEGVDRFEYHKEPGKTADFFDAKGRSKPGDMGWVDADGYLYLTDRASHMIISGGVNIYPQEIEAVLTLHPSVRDVAVVGVPDLEFGEQVKAVVEPAEGATADDAMREALMAYCREHLAGFKCPKTVDFVDELPRLPTGKLLKRELRKRYWPENRTL